jgi:hypothetical protein
VTITSQQRRAALLGMTALAIGLRCWLLSRYPGDPFDINSALIMRDAVLHHGLHAYGYADTGGQIRYPYPPGWVPIILACVSIAHHLGTSVSVALRAPLVGADIALAWLVQAILGWTGRSESERLVGAGLILLGPPIFAVSVLQGQLDTVSALAVVGGLAVWLRATPSRRWLWAGLVIGAGAAIKTTPIFVVLALLPTAIDNRERLRVAAVALAIPVLAVLPFAAVNHHTVHAIASYHGAPGAGGLSLLAQPRLAYDWLTTTYIPIGHIDHGLGHVATVLGIAGVAIVTYIAWRCKADPLTTAVLIYAALLLSSVNFFLQYVAWLLPLVIAWGALRIAAAVTAIWTVPLVFRYAHELHWHGATWSHWAVLGIYVPVMDAIYVVVLCATIRLTMRIRRSGSR